MRILHVLDHSLPLQSGYVTRTLGILTAQRGLGWDTVHLTTPRQNIVDVPTEEFDGWTFHRTPAPKGMLGKLPIVNYWAEMKATEKRLLELAKEVKPDIIHAHSPLLNGYPALWVGRKLGIPVVYEVRAFWEDAAVNLNTARDGGARVYATRCAETRLMTKVDGVVALCEGVRDEMIRRHIPEDKIDIAQNAVVIERFPPTRERDDDLATSLGLSHVPVLGFIGSFYDYEGLEQLLEAVAAIKDDLKFKVLLVGGGPRDEFLRKLATDLGLDDLVTFTGRVPFEQVNTYYDLVDIFVFPRKKIRLTDLVTPLKPIEVMAKKRIVIASDVGGHKEMLEDGKTGFLFKADNVGALTEKLRQALEHPEAWPAMQEAGRAYVEANRTWAAVGRQYETIYGKILTER